MADKIYKVNDSWWYTDYSKIWPLTLCSLKTGLKNLSSYSATTKTQIIYSRIFFTKPKKFTHTFDQTTKIYLAFSTCPGNLVPSSKKKIAIGHLILSKGHIFYQKVDILIYSTIFRLNGSILLMSLSDTWESDDDINGKFLYLWSL